MGINLIFCGIPVNASEALDSSSEQTTLHQPVVIKTCQVREALALHISEDIAIVICQGDA